ncbi:unnamed protein product [Lactuca saligna]|uniref:Uncharacterized protein n=1 Tax=Lactuca saligna TaxID=75948 RepID=A0AA35ZZM4_LACSI|nr:unnamed protein product [Lactuca saligna]
MAKEDSTTIVTTESEISVLHRFIYLGYIFSHKSFDSKLAKGCTIDRLQRVRPSIVLSLPIATPLKIIAIADSNHRRLDTIQSIRTTISCLFPTSPLSSSELQYTTASLSLLHHRLYGPTIFCYSNKGESGHCIEECRDTTMNKECTIEKSEKKVEIEEEKGKMKKKEIKVLGEGAADVRIDEEKMELYVSLDTSEEISNNVPKKDKKEAPRRNELEFELHL